MRPAPRALLLLATLSLAAVACNEGRIEFDLDEDGLSGSDGDTGASSGSGGSAGSGGVGGGTTDPDEGDTDEPGSGFAGVYEGEQSLGATAPNGEWIDLCWGEATWEVSDDGALAGRGDCEIQRGPADGESLFFDYAGTVDPDGMTRGEVVLTRSWMDGRDTLELEAWIVQEGGERWIEAWMSGTFETRDGDMAVEGWAWGGSW